MHRGRESDQTMASMVNAGVCEMEMRRLTDTFKKARAAELHFWCLFLPDSGWSRFETEALPRSRLMLLFKCTQMLMSRSATTIILRTSRTSRRVQVVPVLLSLPLPFENSRYSIYKHLKWDFTATTTANEIQWIHTHGLLLWQNLHLENKMYLFFESVRHMIHWCTATQHLQLHNTSQRCVTNPCSAKLD